jgi:hypothetical protein
MANLLIQTQYCENYAAHNEDYVHGVSEPYWKYKGGSSYVVAVESFEGLEDLVQETAFLHTYSNEASEEYVLGWEVVSDSELASKIEPWESPYILEKNEAGQWTSKKVTDNGDYGYLRSEITSRVQVWTYEAGGTVDQYHVEYVMEDGTTIVGDKPLSNYLKAVA